MKRLNNTNVIMGAIVLALSALVVSGAAFAGQESGSVKDVKKETAEALEAIKNYSAEQRDETVKKVKQVMNDLDKEMERLEEKIDKKWGEMDKAARKNARETMKTLREQRNELAEWYGGIQHSSANAWDDVKRGFIKSYNALKESFSEAAGEF